MNRKIVFLCGLALAGLVACTPDSVAPATELSPTAKTIVIIPSLPNYLIVATRGVTVFGNNLDTPSISDWNLDQLVYNSASSVLSPRYSVSEATPKHVLADFQSRMFAMLDNDDGIADLVKSEVAVTPAPDYFIVFCVSARSHPYNGTPSTPAFMTDIGVSYLRPLPGLSALSPPDIHSFLEMTIIDGHTMKVIYDTPITMPPGSNVTVGLLASHDSPYPLKPLKDFQWHDKWSDMTPAEQQEIKSGIEGLLVQAVGFTVQQAVVPQT